MVACGGSSSEPSPAVNRVDVVPASASLEVGKTLQLTATSKDADGSVITGGLVSWATSAVSVASVSSSGMVTANALGTAVITASNGSKNGYSTITVVPEPIASITVSPGVDTLTRGETVQLTATLRDAGNNVVTGRTVTWTSADPGIASVSSQGLVTGIGDGVVSITASADNHSAAATIRVFGRCSPYLARTIAIGQTLMGELTEVDCRLKECVLCGFYTDSSYADLFVITVTAPTAVQIDMRATTYDTYLELKNFQDGVMYHLAQDDDADPDDPFDPDDPVDKNAQLFYTLVPGRTYVIMAEAAYPLFTGQYELKVTAVAPALGRPPIGR